MLIKLRLALLFAAIFSLLLGAFFVSPEAYLQQARSAYGSRDNDQALRLGRRALFSVFSSRETKVSALLILTQAAYKMKRPEVAIDYLDELLALDSSRPFPWLFRGRLHQESGHTGNALIDLEKGFSLIQQPQNSALVVYYSAWGQALLDDKQIIAARKMAEKGIAINANAAQPHLLLSHIYEQQENPRQALVQAEKAYDLFQQHNSSFVLTPQARTLGDYLVKLRMQVLN